jgi:FixJ family two-component response regulator
MSMPCLRPSHPAVSAAAQDTVMVLDEDPISRNYVCDLLRLPGQVVRPFESVEEFFESYPPDACSCVVLEVLFASTCGLELQRRMAAVGRSPQMVFLTKCNEVSIAVKAMHAGAVDFLTKPTSPAVLMESVALALEIDRRQRFLDHANASVQQLLDALTPRERQVMILVTNGHLNKQIASDLMISEVTVKMHRGQVMRKLGVKSVAQLTRMVERVQSRPTDQRIDSADLDWLHRPIASFQASAV